jgi:hypothetical protein
VQDVRFRTKEDLMSRKGIRKAQRITVDAIATVAATGVARALEARHAAGRELNSQELSHISGGNSFYPDSPNVLGPYDPCEPDPIYTMGFIEEDIFNPLDRD